MAPMATAPSPSWRSSCCWRACCMPAACWALLASGAPRGPSQRRRCWPSPRSCSSGRASRRSDKGSAMSEPVAVPLWLFVAIAAFALWSLLDRLLIPSGRWLLRRRLNRLIDTVNRRLDVEIKPFQLTKRQVLIDRLVYDPQVVSAANDYARANNMPREAAMTEVHRYAREIVPT